MLPESSLPSPASSLSACRSAPASNPSSPPGILPGTRPTAGPVPAGTGGLEPIPAIPGHARVADFRSASSVLQSNSGASLIDIGDNIACIELHSLKNAIGGDVVSLISSVLNPSSDAVKNFAAFVITGDRDNFSVGANLLQLLLTAQEGGSDGSNAAIHAFQQMTTVNRMYNEITTTMKYRLKDNNIFQIKNEGYLR